MVITSLGFSIPTKAISTSQFALNIMNNLISSVAVLALTPRVGFGGDSSLQSFGTHECLNKEGYVGNWETEQQVVGDELFFFWKR